MRADGADERVERIDGHSLLVEWFAKGDGLFGVDRRRSRERGADHGRITERRVDGSVVQQWIRSAAEVDERVAAFRSGGGPAPERLTSTCPRCDEARVHIGRRGFLENVGMSVNLGFEGKRTELDLYACPTCHSVELFLATVPARSESGTE